MNIQDHITKASLDANGSLNLLKESLEKELTITKHHKSKQRQIEWVKTIKSEIATIFEYVDKFEEMIMRLEGCCLSHGVASIAIKDFKMKPMIEVVNDVKRTESRQYRIPFYLIEAFDDREVKTSNKPILKWTYVDGKLTPDRKLKSTMPTVKEIIEGRNLLPKIKDI